MHTAAVFILLVCWPPVVHGLQKLHLVEKDDSGVLFTSIYTHDINDADTPITRVDLPVVFDAAAAAPADDAVYYYINGKVYPNVPFFARARSLFSQIQLSHDCLWFWRYHDDDAPFKHTLRPSGNVDCNLLGQDYLCTTKTAADGTGAYKVSFFHHERTTVLPPVLYDALMLASSEEPVSIPILNGLVEVPPPFARGTNETDTVVVSHRLRNAYRFTVNFEHRWVFAEPQPWLMPDAARAVLTVLVGVIVYLWLRADVSQHTHSQLYLVLLWVAIFVIQVAEPSVLLGVVACGMLFYQYTNGAQRHPFYLVLLVAFAALNVYFALDSQYGAVYNLKSFLPSVFCVALLLYYAERVVASSAPAAVPSGSSDGA